ncbi:uncharacterized protein [Lepeophtheirus salmonis]|uniref:uncharacterized protein n=1 Tax=Lepeophtheirus salmonis TaxID=72036 RepID=UPI001AE77652|nr:uncharacterized protein LOC121128525 [Lepeophtheirus salmonis]
MDRQDTGTCFYRKCSQVVSARNLQYEMALRILQEEEYLGPSDFSNILRRKRRKRQIRPTINPMLGNMTDVMDNQDGELDSNDMENLDFIPEMTLMTVATVVMLGAIYFFLAPNNALLALSSVSAPLPGSPGGGMPIPSNPSDFSQTTQEGTQLAPSGTLPLSVFPPFATPRRVPAVCVLFKEASRPGWSTQRILQQISLVFRRLRNRFIFGRTRNTLIIDPNEIFGFACNLTQTEKCFTINFNGDLDSCQPSQLLILESRQIGESFYSTAEKMCRTISSGVC